MSRGHWDGGRSDGSGLHDVLGSSGHVGGGRLGDGLLASHNVLVSGHNTGVTSLDSPGTDHSVLHSVLHQGGTGSVAVGGLSHHGGGGGHGGGHQGAGSVGAGDEPGGGEVGGSSHGDSQKGE